MDERKDEINALFNQLQLDIDELSKIGDELYKSAIRAAVEPWFAVGLKTNSPKPQENRK